MALINREAADTVFAGEDPIGRQVMIGPSTAPPRTIVGVVGDVRHQGLDRSPTLQVYVPQAQWVWAETLMTLVVRTTGEPTSLAAAVRGVVRDIDPAQPVTDVASYADVVSSTSSTRRFVAGALGVFAALALVLAMVGLYGALSVTVAQRGSRSASAWRWGPGRGHPADGVHERPAPGDCRCGRGGCRGARRPARAGRTAVRSAAGRSANADRGAGAADGGRGGSVCVARVAGVAHRSGAIARAE